MALPALKLARRSLNPNIATTHPLRTTLTVKPCSVSLAMKIAANVEVTFSREDGEHRRVTVAIEFPEEARAVFEELSWRPGESIVDTVYSICAAYAEEAVGLGESSNGDVVPVVVPHAAFRGLLAAVREHRI